MILGLALLLGMIMSTRADRREAARKLARHNWKFAALTAAIWGFLLLGYLIGGPPPPR